VNQVEFEDAVRAAARRISERPAPERLRSRMLSIPASSPPTGTRKFRLELRLRAWGAMVEAALVVEVLAVVAVGFLSGSFGARTPSKLEAPSATPIRSAETSDGVDLVATFDAQPELMTAAGGAFSGVEISSSGGEATLIRIDPDGAMTRQRLTDHLAGSFSATAIHGSALYVATNVIKRSTASQDEVLRIDASQLTVDARATLPGGVLELVADSHSIWVALRDRVLRLDASSLSIQASRIFPDVASAPEGSASPSSVALGPNGVWVVARKELSYALYRLDLTSLDVSTTVTIPDPSLDVSVVGNGESLWLMSADWVRRVSSSGALEGPIQAPGLQAAAAQGDGLVVLLIDSATNDTLVQFDAQGNVLGRGPVGDAGARLAIDGSYVWLLHGASVAKWTLLAPQP
jgi:hypothetical protein